MHRDIDLRSCARKPDVRGGRSVIAVIGIDHYLAWTRLENAVSDAAAVSRLFRRLGFDEVTRPLLDDAATGEALRRLVSDDLAQLSPDDSLVLFFAGHGHTHTAHFGDVSVKTGCVIPVDGARPHGHVASSWLRLDTWLSDIARLPPRHILVIVDACHSGISLAAAHRWRAEGPCPAEELTALQARRSRRIITSALDDQRAMDGGPYPGHSLFTGCLIEALSGGLAVRGQRVATGGELGLYLQQRVRSYPPLTQTPDFGAFELDNRGDLVLPLEPEDSTAGPAAPPRCGTGRIATGSRRRAARPVRLLASTLVVGSALAGVVDGGAPRSPTTGDASTAESSASSAAVPPAPEPATVAPNIPGDANADAVWTTTRILFRSGTQNKASSRSRSHERGHVPHASEEKPTATTPPLATPQVPSTASGNTPPVTAPSALDFAAGTCSKADFAAVYEAATPSPDAVHAALHALNACRDAGAVSTADFDRYQTALIAKR